VDLETDVGPARRRRGQELEEALLSAAWDELTASGYGQFTIEAVAERAGTSRPVIYRRWATKQDIVLAAIKFDAMRRRQPLPDTGTLRGDLLRYLGDMSRRRASFTAIFSVLFSSAFQQTGLSPADLREQLIDGSVDPIRVILDQAVARGEISESRITPRIVRLPLDLLRHESLMTLKPVPDETLVEIVDELFIPLVR
jgi:AcrR family transcriptional regulator